MYTACLNYFAAHGLCLVETCSCAKENSYAQEKTSCLKLIIHKRFGLGNLSAARTCSVKLQGTGNKEHAISARTIMDRKLGPGNKEQILRNILEKYYFVNRTIKL